MLAVNHIEQLRAGVLFFLVISIDLRLARLAMCRPHVYQSALPWMFN